MPDKKLPEWISREEAAALANVDIRTIDRWVKLGHVEARKPKIIRGRSGIRVLIKAADVEAVANAAPTPA